MTNYEEKIKGLFGNEEFVKKFDEVGGPEELKQLFDDYGAELTDEEIAEVINAATNGTAAELDEAALENVNGGVIKTLATILFASWKFAVKTYGSEEKAIREIGLFWARKLGYKG
ncbi:MAG: hypothetical protein E7318_09585 [Clostridiales bacterium]|nr:hypothetical protein [Clostridiales bacterium]